jgi:hypothetical protein
MVQLGLTLAALLYSASSGPVLAFHCRVHHSPTTVEICRIYKPAFRICPAASVRCAKFWGVSELEAFILLQPYPE